jgi:hypothetical protein
MKEGFLPAAVLGLAVAALALGPAAVRAEDLSDRELRRYRVMDLETRGEDAIKINPAVERVVEYTSVMRMDDWHGRRVYCMEREEKTAEGDRTTWKHYLDPATLGLIRIEKKTVSRSGATVREQWIDYRDPMFNYPDNLCHIYTITAYLRGLDLVTGMKKDIHLLLDEDSAPWHMFVVVEGEEEITAPAGTFTCFRVKLEPDYPSIMGKWSWTSPLIKRFVPDYYFWVDKAFPHPLVRFQGAFGPVGGSPPQTHDLMEILPLN